MSIRASWRSSASPGSPAISPPDSRSARTMTPAPGGGGVGRRGRHARAELLDRRRLQDVERLALRDPPLGIDQAHFADAAAPRRARGRARRRAAPAPMIAMVDMRGDESIASLADAMVGIVTGGSKGIGLAIARAFLDRGMQVTISAPEGRRSRRQRARKRPLGTPGGHAAHRRARTCGSRPTRSALVDETVRRFGGVDVLVNNAGVGKFANVADMSLDDWRQIIDTNLERRLLLHARRDPEHEAPRRRLHHQHQQPRGQEPVCRRRRLLRVEGRPERLQRGADAGGAPRQHPRQLRDARLGVDRVRRSRIVAARPTGSSRRRTSRGWSSICRARRAQPAEPRRAAAVAARARADGPR